MNISAQRAALTRAVNSGDPARIIGTCTSAVLEWNATYWPDDWSRWQRALDDMGPLGQWHRVTLEDLV